jgi:hypothetical protein
MLADLGIPDYLENGLDGLVEAPRFNHGRVVIRLQVLGDAGRHVRSEPPPLQASFSRSGTYGVHQPLRVEWDRFSIIQADQWEIIGKSDHGLAEAMRLLASKTERLLESACFECRLPECE